MTTARPHRYRLATRRSLACVLALFATALLASIAGWQSTQAAQGDLDGTFGSGGKVLGPDIYQGQTLSGSEVGNAAVLQPDGKMVVVGDAQGFYCCSSQNMVVARYNQDGSSDVTFGKDTLANGDNVGGSARAVFEGEVGSVAQAVALQPDGKIIVAGYTANYTTTKIALARFTTEGVLDSTFGSNGSGKEKTIISTNARATAVAVQTDGKILVTSPDSGNFLILRYTSTGVLDTTITDGVLARTDFNGRADYPYAMLIQPADGKIIVGGETYDSGSSDFAIARYNADGSLDGNFSGGKVTTHLNTTSDTLYALALQPDGMIIAAGKANTDFALARYTSTGALDSSGFGAGGKVVTDFGGSADFVRSVVLQRNGKIIAAGGTNVSGNGDFAFAQYTTNGTPDSVVGVGGKVSTDFGSGEFEIGYAAAIQDNGNLIVAGTGRTFVNSVSKNAFALARYETREPEISLSPIADAYVKGATGFEDTNLGTTTDLQVKRTLNAGSGNGRQSYLRFDTTSVFGTVGNAKLRVYGNLNAVVGANQDIPCAVFPVSDTARTLPEVSPWTELGITWNNKPTPNVPVELARITVTDATARWYEFDITDFINSERAAGRAVTGVLLRNMTAGEPGDYFTVFNSREAGSNKPELIIQQ